MDGIHRRLGPLQTAASEHPQASRLANQSGSRLPQSKSEWKNGEYFHRTCSCDVFKTG